MDEAAEGLDEFVVARSETATVLEAIEAALDAIAKRVDRAVNLDLNAPVLLRGDHWCSATLLDIVANGVRVVTSIREQHLRVRRVFVHQGVVPFDVICFARGERGSDREALGVRAEMNLGREATARTAKSVSLNPPFPPAAW
jgi:hypothetical protein